MSAAPAPRDRIAAILDPAAFEDHGSVESLKHTGHIAAIQWAARRHMAYEGADRILAAFPVLAAEPTTAVTEELLEELEILREQHRFELTRKNALAGIIRSVMRQADLNSHQLQKLQAVNLELVHVHEPEFVSETEEVIDLAALAPEPAEVTADELTGVIAKSIPDWIEANERGGNDYSPYKLADALLRDFAIAHAVSPDEPKPLDNLVSSGEHEKVVMYDGGLEVCDTCLNDLGLNVRWDQAHPESHYPKDGKR